MSPHKNGAEQNQLVDGDAASYGGQMSKRERRRAEKEAKKAEKQALKEAKKAQKASRKGDVAPAPIAPSTPAEALGAGAAPQPMDGPIPDSFTPITSEGDYFQPAGGTSYDYEVQEPAGDADFGFVPAVAGNAAGRYSRYAAADPNAEIAEQIAEADVKRKRRRRRKVVAVVLIVLLCLVGAGTAGAYFYLQSLNQNLASYEDEEEAEEVKEVLTPVPIGDEPFYMLLVGCDDREGVEGARADTTILARLAPGDNTVTLISIPRDTAIEIPDVGLEKFNAAYAYGGPSGTIEAASQLCGVEISHYAEVHFEALISIIDYIGGVDIDVPIPIDDVDAGGKLDAGYQHLNGQQAMIFARSRSYSSGDFQRTTSQRLLIEAAVEKVMAMPATELPGLLMEVSQCLTSDMSVQELLGLAMAFQDEPDLVMYSTIVPSTTADIDGVSYVITDEYLLQEMMAVVNEGGDPATVAVDESVVTTSAQAQEQGIELIINYGDDATEGDINSYGTEGYGGADYYYYYEEATDYSSYDDGTDEGDYEEDDSGYSDYEDETDYESYDDTGYDDTGYDDSGYDEYGDSGYEEEY